MDIAKKLMKLGLTEKEASLYLTGLGVGPSTILDLSKKSGIKRGTVYEIITSLVSLGFFTKTLKNKKVLYLASDPNILKIIQNEREGLLESIFPILRGMSNPLMRKPQIYFFDDLEDIRKIHLTYLKAQKKEILGLEGGESASLFGEEWIREYIKKRKKLGIVARSIMDHSSTNWVEKNKDDHRVTKLLPKGKKFEIAIEIYDESILLTSLKNEVLCLAIENKLVADAMRTMFEIMWEGI